MIVHAPRRETEGGRSVLVADVEAEGLAGTRRLWFRAGGIEPPERADAFACALLLAAMNRREPLEVRGPLSPRLAHGLEVEYGRAFVRLFPKRFVPVPFHAQTLSPPPPDPDRDATMLLFTGGVDSFFSLHSLSERPRDAWLRPTHLLYSPSVDFGPTDEVRAAYVSDAIRSIADDFGMQTLLVETNVRQLLADLCEEKCDWTIMHGAALAACGLAFGSRARALVVPSTFPYEVLYPNGSLPQLDPLLATEVTDVLHHGAGHSRFEKTISLAELPSAWRTLRPCWQNADHRTNCCRCTKCVYTMLALDLAGTLDRFETFPAPLRREQVRALLVPAPQRHFVDDAEAYAREHGRPEIARDLRGARRRQALRNVFHRRI